MLACDFVVILQLQLGSVRETVQRLGSWTWKEVQLWDLCPNGVGGRATLDMVDNVIKEMVEMVLDGRRGFVSVAILWTQGTWDNRQNTA